VHHQLDARWHKNITPWAIRNAIRILPIAEQCVPILYVEPLSLSCMHSVANAFRKEFRDTSSSLDPAIRPAGYEFIPVDAHVPVLNIPGLFKHPRRTLSNAVIQGSLDEARRGYHEIFKDLIQSLHG